ncbi:MAG: lyase family protein, partial [Clostridiales bacterium]
FMDEQEISNRLSKLQFLGSKGATGTQASFCQLFAGNREKIRLLEQYIATDMGFNAIAPVSGQTYSRKVDANMLATLSGIAQSAHKFANDIRLLQSFEEIEEPFETQQIGSSAMPYKRNPMRAERITALARYVISDSLNPAFTAANQWFERTLDDSANKRIAVAEAFLAVDAILDLYINISAGLVVYPGVIAKRVGEKLPFMATENILMQAVQKGGDRQQLHEKLRQHTHAAAYAVKTQGSPNDLLQRIAADPAFALDQGELSQLLNPADYIGLAQVQTSEFLTQIVQPLLDQYPQIDIHPQLQV